MVKGNRPLSGIRVLEMSTYVAVPTCGRILAEMGADVIKIENLEGDPYRRPINTYYHPNEEEQPLHDCLNCYKKSVAVNMKDSRVHPYIQNLIKESDIFLSNVRLNALERLGLSYDRLEKINPKIVYGHFTGYGEKGPKANKPGYDSTAYFAQSGIYRDFVAPDAPPLTHIGGLGDVVSGTAFCTGILCAWINAQKTGKGVRVTSALNGNAAWGMMTPLVLEQYGSNYQREYGNPMFAGESSYICNDGEWIFIVAATDKQWEGLAKAINRPELSGDPKYANAKTRLKYSKELFSIIASEMAKKPYKEWEMIMTKYDVPFEKVRHVREMAGDEQLVENDFIYGVDYSSKKVWLPRPPFKIDGVEKKEIERGPQIGQHTKEVFLNLGCTEDEIKELADTGAIRI